MYRILVVEDDRGIASAVCRQMESWGLQARAVEDFRDVLGEFSRYDPHLILMDIVLPFYNGYHWCSQIRKVSKVPVIFLSSASDNMNIVMAVNMGGDDFVAKPFDANVLTAKVQAVLRRTYDYSGQVRILEHRGAMLNTADATLTVDGKRVELTKNEYRILQSLIEQKGSVVSRERLMEILWDDGSFVDENTLSVNMTRLRRKLDSAGLERFIATKVGMGYLIEADGQG